jgi:GntR family transcriptional repressor for pyruvate dehydrogenase complex
MEGKRKKAVQTILDAIKSGQYRAGEKLPPERELAHRLGLSRNLLREAIGALEALGVIEVKERLGIFVSDVGFQELVENNRFIPLWSSDLIPQFYEMRLTIDVRAAQLAALRREEAELAKMKECLSELALTDISTPEGKKRHAHYELLLHTMVVGAAHNTIFSRVFEGLMMVMERNTEILHIDLTQDEKWAKKVVDQHRKIVSAIESRDADLAGQVMENHLSESLERFWNLKAYKGSVEK